VFCGLTFGVGFAALNTGNNLLYLVLSGMLGFLVLSGVLSESALRGVRVVRRLPREMFAETAALVALEIHNDKRRVPAFALVVEDSIDTDGEIVAAGRAFALRIEPAGHETRAYALTPTRRGPLAFTGFRIATRFPFGLFSKSLVIDAPQHTLVYPAVDRLHGAPVSVDAEEGGGGTPRGALSGEATGVREHRPGDPLRRIHWPATLRTGALIVRSHEAEPQSEHELYLHTRGESAGDAFEADVRWAASECVRLLESGARVGLRTDSLRLAPADGALQRARLLGVLARVAPDASSDPHRIATAHSRRERAA
jgi:uncharacterized protein (DUF58 family)